jgi:hypothetical protein
MTHWYISGGGELVHRLIFNEEGISEAALLPSSGKEGTRSGGPLRATLNKFQKNAEDYVSPCAIYDELSWQWIVFWRVFSFPLDPYLLIYHQRMRNGTVRGGIPAERIIPPKANATRIAELFTARLTCAFTFWKRILLVNLGTELYNDDC